MPAAPGAPFRERRFRFEIGIGEAVSADSPSVADLPEIGGGAPVAAPFAFLPDRRARRGRLGGRDHPASIYRLLPGGIRCDTMRV